jgi:Glucose / Sorbosone dehydrogenase
VIKVFDSLTDTTADVFADLNVNVHNFWDRGLLGMTLAPNFPTNPYVYVLYTYDHVLAPSSSTPRWGTPGVYSDPCPAPPGATADGCVVSGRLSRLQAAGNAMTGSEQVLVEDCCQQYPSHSVGTVRFGRDGALYASAGDGASFNFADWGQDGSPVNPCGDPPGPPGTTLSPPTAEGGALRSQDLRTTSDPVSLDGSIIRVDPATGAGLPNNPLAASSDPNAKRIIAHGLRNPFRFTQRPGTDELWIGDVGWNDWEEINRVVDSTDPRCPMHVKTDVPLLGHDRLAGVDADPDVHGSVHECVLNAVRGEHRVARAGERDEERVALRVHFDPAVPGEHLAQCAAVLGEHLRVPFAELIQKACRALDVREEQSDRAAGKLPHAHMIALGRGISKEPAGSLRVEPWSTSAQRATERVGTRPSPGLGSVADGPEIGP